MFGSQPVARWCGREEVANLLLRRLPERVFNQLLPHLDFVVLPRGQTLGQANGPVEHIYFVNRGLIALIRTMHDGRTAEVGAIGVEGIAELSTLFGSDETIRDAIVQISGNAFRIRRSVMWQAITNSESLRTLLQRYVLWAIRQLTQTAACNRLHTLEQRCCRCLLTAQDNARSDTFSLTHESVALALGAQRSSVSIVTHGLRSAGCIDYHVGNVKILDRSALLRKTCECYETIRAQLDLTVRLTPQPASVQGINETCSVLSFS